MSLKHLIFFIIPVVLFAAPPQLINVAMTPQQMQELISTPTSADANFGTVMDAYEDTVVIGAPGTSYNAQSDAGAVYVFTYDAPSGMYYQQAILTASDADGGDKFGSSVSINLDAVVGEVIAVGAPNNDDNGSSSGAAYIYEKPSGNWATATETVKLTASDAQAYARFGSSIDIQGSRLLIGASGDDHDGNASGSAYLYTKPASSQSNALNETSKLTPSDSGVLDGFGSSVALSYPKLFISSPSNGGSGSVYVLNLTGSSFLSSYSLSTKLPMPNAQRVLDFGRTIASDGDGALLVGSHNENYSGVAHLYQCSNPSSDLCTYKTAFKASDASASDHFGYSLAIDRGIVVIGARYDDDAGEKTGAAYVYEASEYLNRPLATETFKLLPSTAKAHDMIGQSVGVANSHIFVGNNIESTHFYKYGPHINSIENKTDVFDFDAVTDDNSSIRFTIIGLNDKNSFTIGYTDGNLKFKNAPDYEQPGDNNGDNLYTFLLRLSSSGESNTYKASIRVSDIKDEAPKNHTNGFRESGKIRSEIPEFNNLLYSSVAINGDTIVVGKPEEGDLGSGAIYIYVYDPLSNTFMQRAYWTPPAALSDRSCGWSIDISDTLLAVGCPTDDDEGSRSGSVYLFPISSVENWWDFFAGISYKITASDAQAYDEFGHKVVADKNNVVVANDKGSAYLFSFVSGGFIQKAIFRSRNGSLGSEIAMDGDIVVFGSAYDDEEGVDSGAIHIFEKSASGWRSGSEDVKLKASDPISGGKFGRSVAINADTIAVGANNGPVYIFEKPLKGWKSKPQEVIQLRDFVSNTYPVDFDIDTVMSGNTIVHSNRSNYGRGVFYFNKPTEGWSHHSATADFKQRFEDQPDCPLRIDANQERTVVLDRCDDFEDVNNAGSISVFKANSSGISPSILMYLLY